MKLMVGAAVLYSVREDLLTHTGKEVEVMSIYRFLDKP